MRADGDGLDAALADIIAAMERVRWADVPGISSVTAATFQRMLIDAREEVNHKPPRLVTDGGASRRDALRAAAGIAALGALPDLGSADGTTPDDAPDPGGWRLKDHEVDVHTVVDLPEAVWSQAWNRAASSDDTDRLTAYLLDHLALEFGFTVGGEVVHATPGFDPERVIALAAPDGEVLSGVVDLSELYGEARER